MLSNFIEKILNTVQDLLVISSPLQQTPGEGILSSDDQLFLYETVSLLIVSSSLEAKTKAQLMKSLLAPIVGCFGVLIDKYCATSDENVKLAYAKCLNTAMSVASRVSKGFSSQVKLKDCECVDIFVEIMRIFLPAVNITTHKSLIHTGVRQYLHRMLVCLDAELLDYLPLTIEHFVKLADEPKDLYDLVPLLGQVINKYKQQVVAFMQRLLMPFVNKTLQFVNMLPIEIMNNLFRQSSTGNLTSASSAVPQHIDPQFIVDMQLMYKSYFQFLVQVINNELVEIISGQQPEDIYRLFATLLQGAQIGTHEIAKFCFQVMRKLIAVFGKTFNLTNLVQRPSAYLFFILLLLYH